MIDGLKELLDKHNASALSAEQFEEELNKILPKTWKPNNVFNELNEKKKLVDKELEETKALLEKAKADKGMSDEWQKKFTELEASSKASKEAYEKQIADMHLNSALEKALAKHGSIDDIAVKAHLDMSKIQFNADGSFTGLDEQIKGMKETSKYLFKAENPEGQPKPQFGKGSADFHGTGSNAEADAIAKAMGINN